MTDSIILDLQALFGVAVFIGLGVLFSANRRAISARLVVYALGLQVLIALVLLKVPVIVTGLAFVNRGVLALADATRQGSSFVFGYLGGAPLPFSVSPGANTLIFAFSILPVVLVVSALAAVCWHFRVLPLIVSAISIVFEKPLNTRGPAGFAVVANVFVGQVEAPLLVKPYIENMTRYELLLLMTAGMTMIAGTMMVVYSVMLSPVMPSIGVHLIVKSMMSIPSAILFAHLLLPEQHEKPAQNSDTTSAHTKLYQSALDALTRGTHDGLQIWLAIASMLLVLVSLVALINICLGALGWVGGAPLSLERLAGWAFAPVAFLMGVPWQEAILSGRLLGVKTVINELMAYLQLANVPAGALSARSELVTIYGLCGFANFASMAIQVSGIAAMAPSRRDDLNALAIRALVGATLASCVSGALVGILA